MQIMGRSSFRVIWYFFKPYKLQVFLLLVLSVMVGILEAANVAAIYPILTTAFAPGTAQDNAVVNLMGRIAELLPVANKFLAYSMAFLVIALLAFIFKLVSIIYRVKFGANLVQKNQLEVLEKFLGADYQYFVDHKQGELIYNVASAPQLLMTLINAVTEVASQTILALSLLLLLLSLSWQGALVVVLVALGYYYFTRYLGGKVAYTSGKGELQALQESNVILNEAISGIKQVKVYDVGREWLRRFSEVTKRRWYHFVRRDIWRQVPTPLLMLVLYLAIGIIAVAVKLVATGNVLELIPVFGTFAFAVFRLFPIIGTMGTYTVQIMGALPNCEVVYAISNDVLARIRNGTGTLDAFHETIKFEHVTFGYHRRARILEDVSLTFKRGETTAIVGRSGAGKTTIVNLLLRLFEPDSGGITVDGADIREYRLSSWLEKIGYVSQDNFIFNDTVRNNITFRDGEYAEAEIIAAASYADAHSFISEMPDGYDTIVGDRGLRLSSGQSQRLAVARAMLRKPEILIFDEATNALDSISEAAVQRAIDEASRKHTVIIIAHRLSSIVNADKIIVLGDGHVLEEGTHEGLMKKRGAYWELYRSQSQ